MTEKRILVRGLSFDADVDDISLFFESHRACPSGGDVEDVDVFEMGSAVVTFQEPEVAQRLLKQRTLSMNGKELKIVPYKPLKTAASSKVELVKAIKPVEVDYHTTHDETFYDALDTDVEKTIMYSYSFSSPKGGAEAATAGEETEISWSPRDMENPEQDNEDDEFGYFTMARNDDFIGKVSDDETIQAAEAKPSEEKTGANCAEDLKPSEDKMKPIALDVKQSDKPTPLIPAVRKNKSPEQVDSDDSCDLDKQQLETLPMPLPQQKLKFIKLLHESENGEFFAATAKSVKITIGKDRIELCGTAENNSAVFVCILEALEDARSDRIHIRDNVVRLLALERGATWLQKKLTEGHVLSVFHVEENSINVISFNDEDFESVQMILKDLISIKELRIDSAMTEFVCSETFKQKVVEVEGCRVVVVEVRSDVVVIEGYRADVESVAEQLESLMIANSHVEKGFELDAAKIRLLKEHHEKDITDVVKKCCAGDSRLNVALRFSETSLSLEGPRTVVESAETIINKIYLAKISELKFDVNQAGLKMAEFKDPATEAGKFLLDVEKKKCIIELETLESPTSNPKRDSGSGSVEKPCDDVDETDDNTGNSSYVSSALAAAGAVTWKIGAAVINAVVAASAPAAAPPQAAAQVTAAAAPAVTAAVVNNSSTGQPAAGPGQGSGVQGNNAALIVVKKGNIAEFQEADILVNIITRRCNELKRAGVVSESFVSVGGDQLQVEINKVGMPKNFGTDVSVTVPTGNLKAKKIYFAAIRKYQNAESVELLYKLIVKCLTLAATDNLTTIAFPTIGCGKLGFQPADVSDQFIRAAQNCDPKLQIFIIAYDGKMTDFFTSKCTVTPATLAQTQAVLANTASTSAQIPTAVTSPADNPSAANPPTTSPPIVNPPDAIVITAAAPPPVVKKPAPRIDFKLLARHKAFSFHIYALDEETAEWARGKLVKYFIKRKCEKEIDLGGIDGHTLPQDTLTEIRNLVTDDLHVNIDHGAIQFSGKEKSVKAAKKRTKKLLEKEIESIKLQKIKKSEGPQKYLEALGYSENYRFPKFWTHYKGECRTVVGQGGDLTPKRSELPTSSHVFLAVKDMIMKTWDPSKAGGLGKDAKNLSHTQINVRKIWAIENPALYQKYIAEKKKLCHSASRKLPPKIDGLDGEREVLTRTLKLSILDENLESDINEYYLIHGTNEDHVDAIAMKGMDSRFAGDKVMFGKGAYFAESSTKADQYADLKDQRVGVKQPLHLFVVRVPLGRTYLAREPYNFKRPPCADTTCKLMDNCSDPTHGECDSVIGTHRDQNKTRLIFREFIVYAPDQGYPDFLVEYERL